MEEAEYCNRLALMNRGRLIALDTPRGLRRRMDEPILEVHTDNAPKAVEALAGADGVLEAAMFGRLLHVTMAEAATGESEVRRLLAAAGRTVQAVHPVEPSLEDVFVSLVRAEGGAVVG
jgi:ABC-2 type transport system ATP-binding protein